MSKKDDRRARELEKLLRKANARARNKHNAKKVRAARMKARR